jgi:hypothetical protein
MVHVVTTADPAKGFNDTKLEGEYWMEKIDVLRIRAGAAIHLIGDLPWQLTSASGISPTKAFAR